jgi:hypothetical protein
MLHIKVTGLGLYFVLNVITHDIARHIILRDHSVPNPFEKLDAASLLVNLCGVFGGGSTGWHFQSSQ